MYPSPQTFVLASEMSLSILHRVALSATDTKPTLPCSLGREGNKAFQPHIPPFYNTANSVSCIRLVQEWHLLEFDLSCLDISVLKYFTKSHGQHRYDNWVSEASLTLGCSIEISRDIYIYILEKWFPLQGERGHSSYFRRFKKQNREEGETE